MIAMTLTLGITDMIVVHAINIKFFLFACYYQDAIKKDDSQNDNKFCVKKNRVRTTPIGIGSNSFCLFLFIFGHNGWQLD